MHKVCLENEPSNDTRSSGMYHSPIGAQFDDEHHIGTVSGAAMHASKTLPNTCPRLLLGSISGTYLMGTTNIFTIFPDIILHNILYNV